MIDDDFLFAIVMAKYLKSFPSRAKAFLDRKDERGLPYRELVKSNFRYVTDATKAFAAEPDYKNLIRFLPNEPVGNWRDSENGLGGGVYPFDVNAALVPGALHALADLYKDKRGEFHDESQSRALDQAFRVWNEKAPKLFEIRMPKDKAEELGKDYL